MAVDIVHHHLELIFLDWVVVTHAAAEQQAEEQQQRDPAPPAFHSGDQHAQHQRNAERGGIEVAIDKQRRAVKWRIPASPGSECRQAAVARMSWHRAPFQQQRAQRDKHRRQQPENRRGIVAAVMAGEKTPIHCRQIAPGDLRIQPTSPPTRSSAICASRLNSTSSRECRPPRSPHWPATTPAA